MITSCTWLSARPAEVMRTKRDRYCVNYMIQTSNLAISCTSPWRYVIWAMMKQTIEECGYRPGEDVAIALDPALSELEIAYREEFDVPDSIGMYLFWRDHSKKVMDRDAVLAVYEKAILEYNVLFFTHF